MASTKSLVPDMGDFKDVEIIEVLVKEGQQITNSLLLTSATMLSALIKSWTGASISLCQPGVHGAMVIQ